jgi:dihydrofolate reductase
MVSIIVAVSENDIIGKDNKLIWRQSDDLKRFKKLTSGSAVIMGRKTYESIGKPLPGRINIVISRNKDLMINGCIVVNSVEEALRKAPADKETFIIGGSQIYEQSIKYVHNIFLTRIHTEVDGDSHFPSKDRIERIFEKIESERHQSDDNNQYDYTYITYRR